mmetsp:Transcript_630/g.1980  ORF Transcript_630/g.1980 Transcript_630/m.1980 type:complete len:313 (-) Transcript_630:369-1307(-)
MGGKCCTDRKEPRPHGQSEKGAATSALADAKQNDTTELSPEPKAVAVPASVRLDTGKNEVARTEPSASSEPSQSPSGAQGTDSSVEAPQQIQGAADEHTPASVGLGAAAIAPLNVEGSGGTRALGHWRLAGKHVKMVRSVTAAFTPGSFSAEEAVGIEAVSEAVDEEFAELMSRWVPRSAKGGAAVRVVDDEGPGQQQLQAAAAPRGPPPQWLERQRRPPPRAGPPAPPARPQENAEENAVSHLDDIQASRQRMADMLARVEQRTGDASTKIQAIYRGKQARKAVETLRSAKTAEVTAAGASATGQREERPE